MMIYLSLIIILTLCGVQSMKNGRQADIIEFPFVVSIQHQLFHLCSGTIIDKYHILTVAHVVVPHPASGLLVVPGMSMVKWPYSTALAVKNIYSHPYYQPLTVVSFGHSNLYWDNDIAILRLNEPLPLNSFIGLISLSTTSFESYRCFECAMISWNYPDENDLELVNLMWEFVYMMENNRCEQWGIQVLTNQQCFIDMVKTAFMSTEDLGSPIICGGFMVGLIVKEARQGEVTSPATMLSTLNYTEFITEIINGGIMNVQPGEFPYMVSIWHGKNHACGGLIVNTNQVITAGQCISSIHGIYPIKSFRIAAGNIAISLFDHNVQWYLVRHMQVHPHYKPKYHVNDSRWWAEHDIGLITLSTAFSWSPTVQRLRLVNADNFPTKRMCQVLHWTPKKISYRKDYKRLTKITAVLNDNEPLLAQLGTFQIATTDLYSVDSAELTDAGNPIICGGHPLGIMVRIYPINVKSHNPQRIFLRIRPYALMKFFDLDSFNYL